MDITQESVKKIKVPKYHPVVIYDDTLKGFGVCVTPKGTITFILNYSVRGRERRMKIGRFGKSPGDWKAAVARDKADELKEQAKKGIDPMESQDRMRDEPTVEEYAKEYMADAETRNSPGTVRNNRSMLKNIIVPELGSLRLGAVGLRDCKRLNRSLAATPYRANRVRALLVSIYNAAIEEKLVTENPAEGVEKYKEYPRQTWLTTEQLADLARALDNYGDQQAANAIRLLILTGAREMEMLHARWREFDLKRGFWNRPGIRTKERKNENPPLSDAALAVLKRMRDMAVGEFLFPGKIAGCPRTTIRKPWEQVCKVAGLSDMREVPGKRGKMLKRWRPTIRLHDLRHTFASTLVQNGVSLEVIGGLLGHARAETTKRYSHLDAKPLRDGTNVFGDVMTRLVQ